MANRTKLVHMRPNEYRASIAYVGLNQTTAALFFCVGERTSAGWAHGRTRVPKAVAMVLRYMMKRDLKPKAFDAMFDLAGRRGHYKRLVDDEVEAAKRKSPGAVKAAQERAAKHQERQAVRSDHEIEMELLRERVTHQPKPTGPSPRELREQARQERAEPEVPRRPRRPQVRVLG